MLQLLASSQVMPDHHQPHLPRGLRVQLHNCDGPACTGVCEGTAGAGSTEGGGRARMRMAIR